MGKNAVFSLRSKIVITDNIITCIMTGTALCLTALHLQKAPSFLVDKTDNGSFRAQTNTSSLDNKN